MATSIGNGVAWDVSVTHDRLRTAGKTRDAAKLQPGEGIELFVMKAWQQPDDPHVHVR